MFGLIGDWLSGKYEVSLGTILAMLFGLVYFVSPMDMILDIIPFEGLLDDGAILTEIIKQLGNELDEYRKWKAQVKDETDDLHKTSYHTRNFLLVAASINHPFFLDLMFIT